MSTQEHTQAPHAGERPRAGAAMDLSGSVAIVTGGASGIGWEIATMLAGCGASVGILDLSPAPDADGLPVRGYRCDIGDQSAVDDAVRRVTEELGGCDILVHNAGWTANKPFLETTVEEQDRILSVNYIGALNTCRAALPHIQARGGGRVVLISSDAARVGTPKEAIYAGAKAALMGFAKSLAVEVARDGITVNVVSPGSTDTPLLRHMLNEDQIERRIRANPMKRLATPADIAGAVAFFVGPNSVFVTGQILSVNGGMSRVG